VGASPLHRNAVQAIYLDIIRSGKKPLIVDCGANIGASTAWFKMMYPEATIVAIEPAPDNFSMLVANSLQFDGINAVEAGIGPSDATAFLQDNGGGACGYRTGSDETSVKINIVSLKTIMEAEKFKNHAPFILKIDIEGAEKDLFEKSSYSSMDCFPVLIFESHDFCMPALKTSSPFFKFHADTGRDFLFGTENVFSIDMNSVLQIDTGSV
jgi:FkbM family methyltransferase